MDTGVAVEPVSTTSTTATITVNPEDYPLAVDVVVLRLEVDDHCTLPDHLLYNCSVGDMASSEGACFLLEPTLTLPAQFFIELSLAISWYICCDTLVVAIASQKFLPRLRPCLLVSASCRTYIWRHIPTLLVGHLHIYGGCGVDIKAGLWVSSWFVGVKLVCG